MRFLRKPRTVSRSVGILSSAFHPPTQAHLALAHAALESLETEEVLFVLPQCFPHKTYDAVTMEERLDLVLQATAHDERFSVAVADAGLFVEIAREAIAHYGAGTRLRFLCGRDAAERIVNWEYGDLPPIADQLQEYELLVAPRQGLYQPPDHLRNAIATLPLSGEWDDVASSVVRQRIQEGRDWEHWIPASIAPRVRQIYGRKR